VANVDTSFDPRFGERLDRLREHLRAQGVETVVISGRRSRQDQQDMIDNAYAYHHGRPLPHPDRGPVNVAAAIDKSPHQFGFGADVQAVNPADQGKVIEAARIFGLQSGGARDPNHVQLPDWQAMVSQPAAPAAPATAAYAAAIKPKAPAPAAKAIKMATDPADYTKQIMDYAAKIGLDPQKALAIAQAEGLRAWSQANPNAQSNIIDKQGRREQSYGDFQLNMNGGMGAEALAAGIDPRDPSQRWAADKFALDKMKSGGVKPWSNPVAQAYLAHGGVLASNQAMESPGPMDPSAQARGSTVNPQPPGTDTTTPAPTPEPEQNWWQKGLDKLTTNQKDEQGNEKRGTSPLAKIGKDLSGGGQKTEVPPLQFPSAPPLDNGQMAGAAEQMMAATMATYGKPLSWSSAPYGAGAGQTTAPPIYTPPPYAVGPQIPGMTLNSLGQGYGYYG
jgi:hypothetical protein